MHYSYGKWRIRTSSPVNSVILECKVRETDVMISYKAITVDCFLVITNVSNFLTMKYLGLQLMYCFRHLLIKQPRIS